MRTYRSAEAAAKAHAKQHGIYAVPGGYLAVRDGRDVPARFRAKRVTNGCGSYRGLVSPFTGKVCHGYTDVARWLLHVGTIVEVAPCTYTITEEQS